MVKKISGTNVTLEFGGETWFRLRAICASERLPWKFEAGTPNMAGCNRTGSSSRISRKIEVWVCHWIRRNKNWRIRLPKLPGDWRDWPFMGSLQDLSSTFQGVIAAFNLGRPSSLHDLYDSLWIMKGVAVRERSPTVPNPCSSIWMFQQTARASFYICNTKADYDKLVDALQKTKGVFQWHFPNSR